MKNFFAMFLVFFGFLFLVAATVGLMYVSTTNKEVSIRNQVEAKKIANTASFDTMFKILQQKAGVTEEYKEAFKEIYPKLIEGRNQDKNLLAKFVTESNPQFDTSLLKDLMVSIEAERKRFYNDQVLLLDYKRAHDDLRMKLPSSLFVGHVPPLEITVVTSDKTEDVFRTGKDNDTNLFKKGK